MWRHSKCKYICHRELSQKMIHYSVNPLLGISLLNPLWVRTRWRQCGKPSRLSCSHLPSGKSQLFCCKEEQWAECPPVGRSIWAEATILLASPQPVIEHSRGTKAWPFMQCGALPMGNLWSRSAETPLDLHCGLRFSLSNLASTFFHKYYPLPTPQ